MGICQPFNNDFLDDLPIDAGSRLCAVVGMIGQNSVSNIKRLSDSLRYQKGDSLIGWKETAKWPEALPDFLDRAIQNSHQRRGFGSKTPGFYQIFRNFILHNELDELHFIIEKMGYRIGRDMREYEMGARFPSAGRPKFR